MRKNNSCPKINPNSLYSSPSKNHKPGLINYINMRNTKNKRENKTQNWLNKINTQNAPFNLTYPNQKSYPLTLTLSLQ